MTYAHPFDILYPWLSNAERRQIGGYLRDRCDANRLYADDFLWPLLLHARRTDNPVMQYTRERLGGRDALLQMGTLRRTRHAGPEKR